MIASMLTALMAVLMTQDAPAEFSRWGEVQAHRYSGRAPVEATLVTFYKSDARHQRYLVAKRAQRLRNDPETTAWADARTCPALAAMPMSLRTLTTFRLGDQAPEERELPDGSHEVVVSIDGPSFVVEAPAEYSWDAGARVRLEAGSGPVAVWADKTLRALASCWSAKSPDPVPHPWDGGQWVWRPEPR